MSRPAFFSASRRICVATLSAIACVLPTALAWPMTGQAQASPRAAMLQAEAGDDVDPDTRDVVGRMIRAELDGLGVVETAGTVALDLSDIQLALGCVGQTPDCLRPVAEELSVRLLLIPHVDQSDGELMLTITVFDAEEGTTRDVVRRAADRPALLDQVQNQLRELFGLPQVEAPPEEPSTGGRPPDEGVVPPSRELSVAPFGIAAAGVVALGVGVGFGVAFTDAQDTWTSARPTTPDEVTAAHEALARANDYAVAADVLFAVGGAAVAAGLIWILVEALAPGDEPADVVLVPTVDATSLGLSVVGDWGTR